MVLGQETLNSIRSVFTITLVAKLRRTNQNNNTLEKDKWEISPAPVA